MEERRRRRRRRMEELRRWRWLEIRRRRRWRWLEGQQRVRCLCCLVRIPVDTDAAAAQGSAAAHANPDERAKTWLQALAPDMDAALLHRLAAIFELTRIGREQFQWLSPEGGGITVIRLCGMVAAAKVGKERDSASVFIAHGTTVQVLTGSSPRDR